MPTNRSNNLNRAVAMCATFKDVVPSYYNLPSLSQRVVTSPVDLLSTLRHAGFSITGKVGRKRSAELVDVLAVDLTLQNTLAQTLYHSDTCILPGNQA